MKRIFQAREIIKKTSLKKLGKNSYSNYDYFTPEQTSELVYLACKQVEILPIFQLLKDELGYYGEISVYDLCGKEIIKTKMRTEMPEIKATNATQQMGGCMTYTNRYMLMSLFDIADNNLDFGFQDNRKIESKKIYSESNKNDFKWLNDDDFNAMNEVLSDYKTKGVDAANVIKVIRQKYKVSKAMELKINKFFE